MCNPSSNTFCFSVGFRTGGVPDRLWQDVHSDGVAFRSNLLSGCLIFSVEVHGYEEMCTIMLKICLTNDILVVLKSNSLIIKGF